jgi:hypothetical protein
MTKRSFLISMRLVSYLIAFAVVSYIIVANTAPFDTKVSYDSDDHTVSALAPPNRIEKAVVQGTEVTKQKDDLIYFTTKMPSAYEKARVKITFLNSSSDQGIEVGFKDKTQWHYQTQIVDNPIFHRSDLTYVGTSTVLYSRIGATPLSAETYLSNPPAGATTGTVGLTLKDPEPVRLPGYTPASVDTVISTPLRSSHTLYAYLENEPFHMSLTKQDLNWYNDPDVVEVRVYKDDDLVYRVTFDDDGITDDSRRLGPKEVGEIVNPGPGLPEPGVYKIVIDANNDTVISNITTNLHKIVLTGPVYAVSNAEAYPGVVKETGTTTLFTNSSQLAVTTHHSAGFQTILVNNKPVLIDAADASTAVDAGTTSPSVSFSQPEVVLGNGQSTSSLTNGLLGAALTPTKVDPLLNDATAATGTFDGSLKATTTISKIAMPKSDILISGAGYFSFTRDQFFMPSMYTVVPITAPEDINMVDYVVSPYTPPKVEQGFMTVERDFDVLSAVSSAGRLSWIIRAPGLKENGREIIIKDIEVTYSKKGWVEN